MTVKGSGLGAPGKKGEKGDASTVPGPKGDPGAASTVPGPKGEPGAASTVAGPPGPAGLGTITPTTPARVLGTAFQPNATKAVLAIYSARTQVTNPLLAGSSVATVTLLSDVSNPPTTERCRASAESSVGLAVSIALTTSNTTPLAYIVPPGHYVRLVSSVTGTGSTSLISQTEEALG